MSRGLDRRRFLQTATLAGFGAWTSRGRAWGQDRSPNDRLNFACIGVGGKGSSDTDHVAGLGNVLGLCDIDGKRLDEKAAKIPGAKTYKDFREMLDELGPKIDAVVVSTPDHTHAPAAMQAMKMGKHVYCQKPLTHSVHEARLLRETAAKMKVATQMGNQGTSAAGFRDGIELIRSGVIGPIREVHVWTNRPFKYWKQAPDIVSRPPETPPVPEHIAWDLFLGPAPERPYHPAYHPGKWRGFWDFGTGSLGDMACHTANLAYMGLKLGLPTQISAENSEVNPETYPAWSTITYQFPARGDLPPVTLVWREGARDGQRNLPPAELFRGQEIPTSGSLLVGSEGAIFSPSDYGSEQKLFLGDSPEAKKPERPGDRGDRPKNRNSDQAHKEEWVEAIRQGKPGLAWSHFGYGGMLTEAMILGNIAVKLGKTVEYDGESGRSTNCPEAAALINPEYRQGWTL